MNIYVKTIITIALSSLCISVMAANKFIVKYKLTETQKVFLLSSWGSISTKEAKRWTRKELMKDLSEEQLDALSKAIEVEKDTLATKIQVKDLYPLSTGAHVIELSEDLDEVQTEQFIRNVEQYNDVDFIEEDKIQQISLQ